MGIEAEIQTPLAAAVRFVGSQSAFARLIGRSQAYVFGLLRDDKLLDSKHVLLVESATGISRYHLREDVYGPHPAGIEWSTVEHIAPCPPHPPP